MIHIEPEPPGVACSREALLDEVFGPARLSKTAERLREGRLPAGGLSFVAIDAGKLVGTIRFWQLQIGGELDALLLGPVAVARSHGRQGIGSALIRGGLVAAERLTHKAVLLVGDEPYYRHFGFRADLTTRMSLPGPVDRSRFLARELYPGALQRASGLVLPAGLYGADCWSRAA